MNEQEVRFNIVMHLLENGPDEVKHDDAALIAKSDRLAKFVIGEKPAEDNKPDPKADVTLKPFE